MAVDLSFGLIKDRLLEHVCSICVEISWFFTSLFLCKCMNLMEQSTGFMIRVYEKWNLQPLFLTVSQISENIVLRRIYRVEGTEH